MKQLKAALESKTIKPTYQRLCVLEYLHKKKHPTADMIYAYIAKRIPTMSKTTVYNTLNLFLESNLVHAITITGTEVRFSVDEQNHHHFLCKRCGKIIDIDVTCPIARGKVKQIEGHRLEEIHGYFRGVCKECIDKEKTFK